ncbi:hypothetical protein DFH08DRAFT_811999 [Mycena albidolilacea]|uniref:Uncharacterized protein n=1 Tax=Mycena albidolilacea TaxID=1033008 RepID=A0AAD6ZV32_9AGAR|nr:hypothetical protein DFH08DRAFT_811999 [Mycena albidolilacea]
MCLDACGQQYIQNGWILEGGTSYKAICDLCMEIFDTEYWAASELKKIPATFSCCKAILLANGCCSGAHNSAYSREEHNSLQVQMVPVKLIHVQHIQKAFDFNVVMTQNQGKNPGHPYLRAKSTAKIFLLNHTQVNQYQKYRKNTKINHPGKNDMGGGYLPVVHKPHAAFGNCAKPQGFFKFIQEESNFQLWDGRSACHWVCGCCGISAETQGQIIVFTGSDSIATWIEHSKWYSLAWLSIELSECGSNAKNIQNTVLRAPLQSLKNHENFLFGLHGVVVPKGELAIKDSLGLVAICAEQTLHQSSSH